MSWGAQASGHPADVAAAIAAELEKFQCRAPEENVKRAAGVLIAAALEAQDTAAEVRVVASGSPLQVSMAGQRAITIHTLSISVQPLQGFV